MEPQLQLEEALLRPMVGAVEEEDQEVGLKRKKHVRPTMNDLHTLDSTISAEHYHAEIITSSSNISSITTNDEDNDELLLVNNGGHASDYEVHHAEEEEATRVFEENTDDEEATADFEENWGGQQKRFHSEDESGTISTVEQHTAEYSNGFEDFVSETTTNLVGEEYDLTAKKSVNHNAEHFVSEKDQMHGEGAFNIPSDHFETQQVPSQHHHHHHHYHHHQEGHTEFVDQVDVKEREESDVIEEIDFEEIDVEETDYNIEEVVEKQNTHDLICPNCSSCITRTVILRRRPKLRKRIKRTRKQNPKVSPTTEVIAPVAPVTVAPTPEAATNPDIDIGDPEAFRCLSCFSFFIRIGTSIFSRTKTEEVRASQKITTSETTSTVTNQVTSAAEVSSSTSVTVTVSQREAWIDHSKDEVAEAAMEPPNLVINSPLPLTGIEAREMKIDLSNNESEYTDGNGTENRALSWQKIQSSVSQRQKLLGTFRPSKQTETDEVKIHIEEKTENSTENQALAWQKIQSSVSQRQKLLDAFRPSKQTEADEVKIDIEKKTDGIVEKEEEDGFLVAVAPSAVSAVQETPGVTQLTDEEEQRPLLVRQTTNDFDILKSIVYGGLMESITSLGVVSSAVGAGASTLNIFVLALANLIGGLFVLAHNLKELRKETDETTPQADTEEGNRYFKVLGRRGRFPIHAAIAVISYIIFGLVAPITYGFSFRVSNDTDYKLASVAAACLFGVFLLALAKAHVKSPPSSYGSYIKTVLEYLTLGVGVSGISFLAGELLDKIMQQLGWLDSTSSVAAATLMQSGPSWASY